MNIVKQGANYRVYDNVVPQHLLLAALSSFPNEDWQWWYVYRDGNSRKYGSTDPSRFPSACKAVLDELARSFVPPDGVFPDLDYHAGGMHMIPTGGWLGGHYDAQYHPTFKWKRKGSLVLFANDEWKDDWGGELIIRDVDRFNVENDYMIKPQFNHAVYFNTEARWHSVNKVIGPISRKTFAIFYWQAVDKIPDNCCQKAVFHM